MIQFQVIADPAAKPFHHPCAEALRTATQVKLPGLTGHQALAARCIEVDADFDACVNQHQSIILGDSLSSHLLPINNIQGPAIHAGKGQVRQVDLAAA